jgi:hypothetical protein
MHSWEAIATVRVSPFERKRLISTAANSCGYFTRNSKSQRSPVAHSTDSSIHLRYSGLPSSMTRHMHSGSS